MNIVVAKTNDAKSATQIKGSVIEAIGKITADPKIEAKGAAQKNVGGDKQHTGTSGKAKDTKT